jgi:hypothetical protein
MRWEKVQQYRGAARAANNGIGDDCFGGCIREARFLLFIMTGGSALSAKTGVVKVFMPLMRAQNTANAGNSRECEARFLTAWRIRSHGMSETGRPA